MSASVGDSFTNTGRVVAARAVRRPRAAPRVGAELHPAGLHVRAAHVELVAIDGRCARASASSSRATTAGYSSTAKPTTFTILRARGRCAASHGRCVRAHRFEPGIREPDRVDHSALELGDARRRRARARLELTPPS